MKSLSVSREDVVTDAAGVRPTDILRADLINAIPQPIMARFLIGDIWPVIDIAVDAGLLRIDVCGISQAMSFSEVTHLIGSDGISHDADDLYNEEGAN